MLERKNDDDYVINLKQSTEKLINDNNTIKEGYNIDPKFIKNLFYRNKKNN